MNMRQVLDRIFEYLQPLLVPHGFRAQKKDSRFRRSIVGGSQGIVIPIFDYQPAFIFSATATVRLEEVQRIVHLVAQTPPAYQDSSITTRVQMKYFAQRSEFRITTEPELVDALKQFASILTNHVIPFLDDHQDLATLDKAMNDSPSVDSSDHPSRGMHALAVAYLADNPEFEMLVDKYRGEMSSFLPSIVASYEKMVDYLRMQRNK